MKSKIYIFRHSESVDNERGIFSGRSDVELSVYGRKQAQQVARKLKDKEIDLAFVSPLLRAKESLDYVLLYHPQIKVIYDERIIERDYGELTGKDKRIYAKKHPKLFPIYHRSYDVPPPDGESIVQVEKRVNLFIKDMLKIIKKRKAKGVVIATHSNAIRPMRKYFENLSNKEMMQIENKTGEIFEYQVVV